MGEEGADQPGVQRIEAGHGGAVLDYGQHLVAKGEPCRPALTGEHGRSGRYQGLAAEFMAQGARIGPQGDGRGLDPGIELLFAEHVEFAPAGIQRRVFRVDHDADVVDVQVEAEEEEQAGEILDAGAGKLAPVRGQGADFQDPPTLAAQRGQFVFIKVVHGQPEFGAVADHRGRAQHIASPPGHEDRGFGEQMMAGEEEFAGAFGNIARVKILAVQEPEGLQQFASGVGDAELVFGVCRLGGRCVVDGLGEMPPSGTGQGHGGSGKVTGKDGPR